MSDSIQTSIYKIRPSIAVIDSSGKLIPQDLDFTYLETQFKLEGYDLQKIKYKDKKHDFRLFYKSWPTDIQWKGFIAEIADASEDILKTNISINEGFILLVSIGKAAKAKIYAITGGFGHTQLLSYIDYQFGLDILSSLIKPDEKVLRSAKERNIIGGVLGSVKYFRGEYNLHENETFGNYYYELRAKLDKEVLKKTFKFTDAELKRGGLCDAKTSFTIKKPLTFARSLEIMDILHTIISKGSKLDLNLLKKLDKSDKALVAQLEKEIEGEFYKLYLRKSTDVNVEVCHRIFDYYFDAVEYQLSFAAGKHTHTKRVSHCYVLDDVLQFYANEGYTVTTQTDFIALLKRTTLNSYDTAGNMLTSGKLMDHLCAEITYKSRSYFLFNQDWYLVKPEFSKGLNIQCQSFIDAHRCVVKVQKWNIVAESENDFNSKHIGELNTLVFDKVTPENIEVCDILKWTANNIYFIHVKEGFNNEMRNLGRQVHISARRILQDIASGKAYLGKLYDELSGMITTDPYFVKIKTELRKLTRKKFLELFDTHKPVFVLAVLDSAKKSTRTMADITKYNSNIAKFCLQQLHQEIRALDTDLEIIELTS